MLIYDQPIDRAKPGPAGGSRAGGLQRARSGPAAVAAEGRDRLGGADLRLRRGCDRQEPDAEIHRLRPALRRSPRTAAGRSRTDAARPGYFRPRDGGGEPGARDHLEQRAAAGDPRHPSGKGSGVRRRRFQEAFWDRCSACSGSSCARPPSSRSRSRWARWKRSIATSTSRRPTVPSSSTSTSGRMSRPRRRCSPTRSRRPISPNPSSRRPPPRGARPPTFPAG